jgi:hypothetical protein
MSYREPPPGWYSFGTHVDDHSVVLEFSEDVGEDGLPFWERPVRYWEPVETTRLVDVWSLQEPIANPERVDNGCMIFRSISGATATEGDKR